MQPLLWLQPKQARATGKRSKGTYSSSNSCRQDNMICGRLCTQLLQLQLSEARVAQLLLTRQGARQCSLQPSNLVVEPQAVHLTAQLYSLLQSAAPEASKQLRQQHLGWRGWWQACMRPRSSQQANCHLLAPLLVAEGLCAQQPA
jgi:hypothetical protein